MKAARFHAKSDIRIETIPNPPPPGPTEVTIDVHWGGICGSDLHEYTVGPLVINTASRPHALTGCCLPLTLGHEFCGRVSKVPEGSKLQVGQAVMVDPRLNCRECLACRSGRDNVCEKWGFLGLNGGGGGGAGFSEKVNVASRMCYVLDESVDLNDAVLIEPLTVGRHALAATGMDDFSGLNVLVVGGGPVGVAVLYNLRAKGVGRLFVSEPTAKRSEMVRELGLASGDDVMNPLIVSVPEECRSRTEGKGVDVVFDCAGIPAGLKAGTDALRAGGTYMNVAGWELPVRNSSLRPPAQSVAF